MGHCYKKNTKNIHEIHDYNNYFVIQTVENARSNRRVFKKIIKLII